MGKDDGLPFEVGQLCEARSFESGYRGAWFRCKIKQISCRKGFTYHLLEYFDYPDEKQRWTKLYQVPYCRKKVETKRELMVRPQYPPIFFEDQMPLSSISEVIVVTTGSWNVGDLVDWWTTNCHWSGKITKVFGNGKAEIELPSPPMGEGLAYEVSFPDLRPSLDWSPEDGWRVPTSMEGGKCRQCARLIHPINQSGGHSLGFQMPSAEEKSDNHVADRLLSSAPASSSHIPVRSLAASDKTSGTSQMQEVPSTLTGETGKNMNLSEDNGSEKTIGAEKNSSLYVRDCTAEIVGHLVEEDLSNPSCPLKKLRTSGGNSLNSYSETLEADFVGLEELVNMTKWLKGLLRGRTSLSNTVQHSWRFVEHRAPSMSK